MRSPPPARLSKRSTWPKPNSKGLYTDGRTFESSVSKDTATIVASRLKNTGIPPEMIRTMKPWMVMLMITVFEAQKAGLDASLGLDKYFFDKARAANKQVVALETAESQIDRFDQMPDSLQEQMLRSTLSELDVPRNGIAAMIGAWRRGDAAALEKMALSSFDGYRGAYTSLIVERNTNWVPQIEACMNRPQPCFVVVGAAHLVGPDGLITLLKQKGYKLEQQEAPTQTSGRRRRRADADVGPTQTLGRRRRRPHSSLCRRRARVLLIAHRFHPVRRSEAQRDLRDALVVRHRAVPVLDTGRHMECRSLLHIARGLAALLHTKPSLLHINHLARLVAVPLGARAWIEVISVHPNVRRTPRRHRTSEVGRIECRGGRRRRWLLSCLYPHAHHAEAEDPKEHERTSHGAILRVNSVRIGGGPRYCPMTRTARRFGHGALRIRWHRQRRSAG
jgi:uncharacterized protein YbaP (TraB family)